MKRIRLADFPNILRPARVSEMFVGGSRSRNIIKIIRVVRVDFCRTRTISLLGKFLNIGRVTVHEVDSSVPSKLFLSLSCSTLNTALFAVELRSFPLYSALPNLYDCFHTPREANLLHP